MASDRLLDEAIAERLKDVAHDLNLKALRATRQTGRDTWTTIEVRHAALYGESRDGWDVTIEKGEL